MSGGSAIAWDVPSPSAPTTRAPQVGAPQDCAPQVGAPQDCAPQVGAPQDCAPQDCAPQDCAPQDCAPQDCAPQDCAPQRAWSAWRAAVRVVGIAPLLLLGAASILVAARWPGTTLQRAARVRRLTRALAAALLRGLAVRVERVGPTPPAVALFAVNHLSWLDILVVLVALPDADVVAKREVGDWPLIGAITRAGSTVLIDRTRRRDVLRVVRTLQARLESGRSVVLFAEGTTTDGADVLPFRSALFEATVRAGVPVVPVTLQPDTGPGGPSAREHVCWWGDASLLPHVVRLAGLRRCRVVVRVGEAIVAGALPAAGSVSGCALRVLRRERRRSASRAAHVAVRRRFAPVR